MKSKNGIEKTHLIEHRFDPAYVLSEFIEPTLSVKGASKTITVGNQFIDVYVNSQRYLLFARDGLCCTKCGKQATVCFLSIPQNGRSHFNFFHENANGGYTLLTKDHKIAKSNGGLDKLDNYVPMCMSCNSAKGSKNTESEIKQALLNGLAATETFQISVSKKLQSDTKAFSSIISFLELMKVNYSFDSNVLTVKMITQRGFIKKSLVKLIEIFHHAVNV